MHNRRVNRTDYVLGVFDNRVGAARRMYRNFVKQGIEKGNRPELVGGGLLRSQGGWAGVKALRESGDYQKGDERILGDGSFVQQVLSETEERLERRYRLRTRGYDFDRIVERVSELVGIMPEEVMKQGKIRGHLGGRARSLLCYWASTEIGVKQGRLAEILKVTQPAISMAVRRGAELVKEDNLSVEG